MPHTYVQVAKEIINALSRDEGLILEEKLILFGMANDHVTGVAKKLEGGLATWKDGLVQ
jgi:hypothetical protein